MVRARLLTDQRMVDGGAAVYQRGESWLVLPDCKIPFLAEKRAEQDMKGLVVEAMKQNAWRRLRAAWRVRVLAVAVNARRKGDEEAKAIAWRYALLVFSRGRWGRKVE
jgi:hypothetical protein